jgi:hypothetical protein
MDSCVNRITTGIVGAMLAFALAGCAATDSGSLVPDLAVSAAPAISTPTPISGDTDGDGQLSAFEKQVLAQNAGRPYTMPDGSIVQIDPAQPLPTAVVAAIQEAIRPTALMVAAVSGDGQGERLTAMYDVMEAHAAATGRGIMFVYRTTSAIPGSHTGLLRVWATKATSVSGTGINVNEDRDVVVQAAERWAATRNYEVIASE